MPLSLHTGLVDDAKAGTGVERLIVAVWPEAYRITMSVLRDHGLAEDAAQDACAAIARSVATLKHAGAFPPWSYKIIVNCAITTARRHPPTRSLDALASLPVLQRAVIVLHYYVGLTSGEIAEAIDVPSSTVRFHLMRARRNLRNALCAVESSSIEHSKKVVSDVR